MRGHLDDIKKYVPEFIPEFVPEFIPEYKSEFRSNSVTNSGMNSGTYFFHIGYIFSEEQFFSRSDLEIRTPRIWNWFSECGHFGLN